MKRWVTFIIVMALLLGAVPFISSSVAQGETRSYLVLADNNRLPNGLVQAIEAAGGTVTNTIPAIGIVVVSSDASDFEAQVVRISGVSAVVENFVIQRPAPPAAVELVAQAGNPPSSGDDDVFFDLQWGHDAVNAPEAWNAGVFGAGVRVAVLDDGIDSDHPDLAPNLNVTLSTSFVPGETFEYIENYPGDPFSHGSHTSGTVAAADNGIGTIGVAPEAELVMVKVLSSLTGSGSFEGVVEGIVYAADIDADVINMSLGAYFPRTPDAKEVAVLTTALNRAAAYAYQNGTTIIASAGNEAADRDHDKNWLSLPADSPHIISVSSTAPIGWAVDPTTSLDEPVFYSNYGQSAIDFAAPGGNVEYPGDESCTVAGLTRPCWVFDLVFSTGSAGSWYWAAGTSMAAPHVAGIAALIISENGGDMHPAHVERELRRRADDLGKPGKDDIYGMGRVSSGY